MGVLINYLSDVLPEKRKLVVPFCSKCKAGFPLHNYFIWPRKCSNCLTIRSWRTWFIEVLVILSSIWLWNHPVEELDYLLSILLLSYLLIVTVIDIENRLILHVVSLFGAFLGFWVGTLLHGLVPTLIGGIAGFGMMLLFYLLGFLFLKLTRKNRNIKTDEEEALGFGDVNLGGIIGLILGWPGVVMGIVLAIFLAGGVSLAFLLYMVVKRRYKPDLAIPYGPFLTISVILLLYLRDIFA